MTERLAPCSILGCENERGRARGWCVMHYTRWHRHGDPLGGGPAVPKGLSPAERFWLKVDKDGPLPTFAPHLGPCWLWTAATDSRGYGRFDDSPFGTALAHRVAFLLTGAALDPALTLDHLCRVHGCVRPSHLEQVTTQVNTARTPFEVLAARQPRRETCGAGHMWADETTRLDPAGGRHCTLCDADRCRRRSSARAVARVERFGFDPGPRSRANLRDVLAAT